MGFLSGLGRIQTGISTGGMSEVARRFSTPTGAPAFTGQRPKDPTFQSVLQPGGGLQERFRRFGVGPASEFESALEEQARLAGTGRLDPAQQAALSSQLGTAGQQQAGLLAQARSGLAMRGGLGTGASERLAQAGMREGALQRQGLRAGAVQAAETGRRGIQQSLAELAEQRKGADIGLEYQDLQSKRAFDMARYQAKMQEYAAGKAASEQERLAATTGGLFGGGGFLGTGRRFSF